MKAWNQGKQQQVKIDKKVCPELFPADSCEMDFNWNLIECQKFIHQTESVWLQRTRKRRRRKVVHQEKWNAYAWHLCVHGMNLILKNKKEIKRERRTKACSDDILKRKVVMLGQKEWSLTIQMETDRQSHKRHTHTHTISHSYNAIRNQTYILSSKSWHRVSTVCECCFCLRTCCPGDFVCVWSQTRSKNKDDAIVTWNHVLSFVLNHTHKFN